MGFFQIVAIKLYSMESVTIPCHQMNETSIQINETFYRWFNFALARIENVHLEICTYLFETKLNGIFFIFFFSDLLWEKNF